MSVDVAHQFRGGGEGHLTDVFVSELLKTRVAAQWPSELPADPVERGAANIPTLVLPEPKQPLNRRQTDGDVDVNDSVRAARRVIAEHAYQLYVEGGCDRGCVAEYWLLAEQAWIIRR